MNVLSLFDGISCGMVALERAGIPVERYDAFEIDKYAVKVSEKNYPQIVHHGDVFEGDFTQFTGYDLLIGGSPCTFWSIAKREREVTPDGMGGKLFMQYVRALRESGCKYFLYENNYSIHKDIKAFISQQLGVEPIMINSALVSAQNRKRCYWTNIPNVTQPQDRGIMLKDLLESGIGINTAKGKSHCMVASYYKAGVTMNSVLGLSYGSEKGRQRVAEPLGAAQRGRYIQSGNRSAKAEGGTEQFIEIRKDNKSNCLTTVQKDSLVCEPLRVGTVDGKSQSREWRIYSVKGKSISICGCAGRGGAKTGLYKIDLPDGDYIIRKLTPVEAERLQTLPDNYTEGISDTQRYKCIGNGWTVDVIAHILRYMRGDNDVDKNRR